MIQWGWDDVTMVYSEHLIAAVLDLVAGTVLDGAQVDATKTRPVVQLGRIIGPRVGCEPTDAALWRLAQAQGTPVPPGTRGAVHGLPDGSTALGLGATRGVIESTGDRLVIVTHPETGRYTAAYRLPSIRYGGLI